VFGEVLRHTGLQEVGAAANDSHAAQRQEDAAAAAAAAAEHLGVHGTVACLQLHRRVGIAHISRCLTVRQSLPSPSRKVRGTRAVDALSAVLLLVLNVVVIVCPAPAGTQRVHWVAGWLQPGRKREGCPRCCEVAGEGRAV